MLNKFAFLKEDVSLEKYNTYGIKSSTKYLAIPPSKNDLLDLIIYLNKEHIKYYILGKGSNVILPDEKFNGVIISLEKLNKVTYNDNIVKAECGISMHKLAIDTINHNLKGLEYLAGIPGTLGGCLYGNAGFKDYSIYDYLKEVEIIRDEKLINIKKEDINIAYRHTSFKGGNDILVSATFEFSYDDKENLLLIVKENNEKRLKSQPLEFKNAGSAFKNPPGFYAGALIEEAGLKGYSINDASVSLKHANFIVNKGNATSKDIKELIEFIQKKIYNEKGILLELEQNIVEWD